VTEKKFCSKCSQIKLLTDFYNQKGNKFNKRSECKDCTKLRNKSVYVDPVKREKKIQANKRYIENNKIRHENYYKEYYKNNKEILSNSSKEHYASVEGRAKFLHRSAKNRAKKFNLEFDLSLAKIIVTLMLGKCERTDIEFDLTPAENTWRNPFAPSIDRVNSSLGYTNENVKVVVNMYNTGKGQHTDEEFIRFCHIVAQRNPL